MTEVRVVLVTAPDEETGRGLARSLLVTSGIMFRRLVIVPYGRMQLVDVTAGPIDRSMGITTVVAMLLRCATIRL